MTLKEQISSIRDGLREPGRLRYKSGTASGAGAATGLTVVDSDFGAINDSWNEAEILITSGDCAGERREISDYVGSTGTFTVLEAFTAQIASGVTFDVGEKRFVSDHQILLWMTTAQDLLITLLSPDAFPAHSTLEEVAGTAGVSAALPSTLGLPPKTIQFRDSSNVEYDYTVLPAGEKDRFRNDAYLGSNKENGVVIFENGKISYRPVNNGTLLLPIVPRFDSVSFSGGSQLPSYLHPLQNSYAQYRGWRFKEDLNQAQIDRDEFYAMVNAINQASGYSIKQGEE